MEYDYLADYPYEPGQEPTAALPGKPGWQGGKWVISRPKLVTTHVSVRSLVRLNKIGFDGGDPKGEGKLGKLEVDGEPLAKAIDELCLATARPWRPGKEQRVSTGGRAAPAAGHLASICTATRDLGPLKELGGSEDTVQDLESGAKMLTTLLDPGFSVALRSKAAWALGKVLTFKNLREKAGRDDVGGMMSLVELLQRFRTVDMTEPSTKLWLSHVMSCMRVLSLDDQLAQELARGGAIPSMVEGVRHGGSLMRSMCVCCLANMSRFDAVAIEIINFGAIIPLIEIVKEGTDSKDAFCQLASWSALGSLLRLELAREKFLSGDGLAPLMLLLLKDAKAPLKAVLDQHQEKALLVLRHMADHRASRRQVDASVLHKPLIRLARMGTSKARREASRVLIKLCPSYSEEEVTATVEAVLKMLKDENWQTRSTAAKVLFHIYQTDSQRKACVEGNAVVILLHMLTLKPPALQINTLIALLNLCELPEVPLLIASNNGIPLVIQQLSMAKDLCMKHVAMCILKVVRICERDRMAQYWPDVLLHEHVVGGHEEVEEFVKAFIEKRRQTDYLELEEYLYGEEFTPDEIQTFRKMFKRLDADTSGALDIDELEVLMTEVARDKNLGVKIGRKKLKEILEEVDIDGTGEVEFVEFLEIMAALKNDTGGGIFGSTFASALTGKLPKISSRPSSSNMG
ncbi:unnamed protein product [Chrysoparadoxa australica]